ncbi:MAG: dioxygenase [Leptospirales bacterium]|nr:dioxygenase [Leptospirales bacterium]
MASRDAGSGAQIVYLSHGGGPMPVLGEPGHLALANFMRTLSARLKRPEAVLVVSAHWEENVATLTGAEQPPMLYDYFGFPPQAYRIDYPAPGDAKFAGRIAQLLANNHIPSQIDAQRGFDHGLFIPLKLIYPEADIPCFQLSLLRGLQAEAHLSLGKALRALARENMLVIGSGSSFHNFEAFFQRTPSTELRNNAFQDWLIETCTGIQSADERERRLQNWQEAPEARFCHPREEHLLPLHVCAAMADRPGEVIFDDLVGGLRNIALLW